MTTARVKWKFNNLCNAVKWFEVSVKDLASEIVSNIAVRKSSRHVFLKNLKPNAQYMVSVVKVLSNNQRGVDSKVFFVAGPPGNEPVPFY